MRTPLAATAAATTLVLGGLWLAAPVSAAAAAPLPGTPECAALVDADQAVIAARVAIESAPSDATQAILDDLNARLDVVVGAATARLCVDTADPTPTPTVPPTTTTPDDPGFVDRDCADFATQRFAQAFYDRVRTAANPDPAQLDADGDGQACEDLFAAATPGTPRPLDPTADDGSTADTSGTQVVDVPDGSASTGA